MPRDETDLLVTITEDFSYASEQTKQFPLALYYFNDRGYPEFFATGFFLRFENTLFLVTAYHAVQTWLASKRKLGIGFNFSVDPVAPAAMISTRDLAEREDDNDLDLAALVIERGAQKYSDYCRCAIEYHQSIDGLYFSDGVSYAYFSGFPLSKNKTSPTKVDETGSTASFMASFEMKIAPQGVVSDLGKDERKFIGLTWAKKIEGNQLPSPKGCSGSPMWFMKRKGEAYHQYLAGVFISFPHKSDTLIFARIEYLYDMLREFRADWLPYSCDDA